MRAARACILGVLCARCRSSRCVFRQTASPSRATAGEEPSCQGLPASYSWGPAFALLIAASSGSHIRAQQAAAAPDFSSNLTNWTGIGGGEWIPVPGSPRPTTQDPRYKYVPNNTGAQPTYRIGDVTNPNLKQWAKDVMKKDNDEVLAGKVAYTPRSSCRLAGVPGFMVLGGGQLETSCSRRRRC